MFAATPELDCLKLKYTRTESGEREKTPEYDDMDKQACRAQQTEQTNGRLTDSGHRDRELKHAGA